MVRADELYAEVSQDPSGKTPSQGLFIGCFIDTSTGIISFTCEGKETRQKFRMEPGMKLFPAVFVKATSKDALQYELGRTSTRDGRPSTELKPELNIIIASWNGTNG